MAGDSDFLTKQFEELFFNQNVLARHRLYNQCMDRADEAKDTLKHVQPDPKWPATGTAILAAKVLSQSEWARSTLCTGVVNMTLPPSDVPLQRTPKQDTSAMPKEALIER